MHSAPIFIFKNREANTWIVSELHGYRMSAFHSFEEALKHVQFMVKWNKEREWQQ